MNATDARLATDKQYSISQDEIDTEFNKIVDEIEKASLLGKYYILRYMYYLDSTCKNNKYKKHELHKHISPKLKQLGYRVYDPRSDGWYNMCYRIEWCDIKNKPFWFRELSELFK